ncbi:hypothetical protein AGDE_16027 [Angomonas deanei]|uniref:Uncharacterized protein n=1 Tax=Angomonas deanei TaxID=59799 RepID=A0A7G2C4M2_9TRYP|nr:hypothetical protein AGDE_16027 [Angomonas deanei]CAD2214151.1 hypothetical protein, conserved [Angomonas deanei]|eukprot:EPY17866.1 hypothetical protein AGDE_16027 [Angomonas deanei]
MTRPITLLLLLFSLLTITAVTGVPYEVSVHTSDGRSVVTPYILHVEETTVEVSLAERGLFSRMVHSLSTRLNFTDGTLLNDLPLNCASSPHFSVIGVPLGLSDLGQQILFTESFRGDYRNKTKLWSDLLEQPDELFRHWQILFLEKRPLDGQSFIVYVILRCTGTTEETAFVMELRDVTPSKDDTTSLKGPFLMLLLVAATRFLPRYILERTGRIDRNSYRGRPTTLSPQKRAELLRKQEDIIRQMKEQDKKEQ